MEAAVRGEIAAAGIEGEEAAIGQLADGGKAVETPRGVVGWRDGQPGFGGRRVGGLAGLQLPEDAHHAVQHEADVESQGRLRSQQDGGDDGSPKDDISGALVVLGVALHGPGVPPNPSLMEGAGPAVFMAAISRLMQD